MTTRRPGKRKETSNGAGLAALEERLGYVFSDRSLLTLALTHRSFVYEARGDFNHDERNDPGTDNEQLEFLGDAVIGLVVSELLMKRFIGRDEGELTRIRSALVSRKRMGELGAALDLAPHLLIGRSAELSGYRERPVLWANASEAVIAAMFLDARRSGRDPLEAITALAEKLLLAPEAAGIDEAFEAGGRRALRDAKTILQERVQAENAGRLRYIDIAQEGPAHARTFTVEVRLEAPETTHVLGQAEGKSKREAQQSAAAIALDHWPTTVEAKA
ncbi:ribonuclease III [Granulicella cerasi]|uniref:Ribonuclease 3 n=1 Tax=Granulicella cerasi TaxID=741063 RepID=A0ABW1Z7R1_9BACT|nr:ribonuclease III [Granulicella cerasi]